MTKQTVRFTLLLSDNLNTKRRITMRNLVVTLIITLTLITCLQANTAAADMYIYWTLWARGIQRADLDGANTQTVYTGQSYDIAFDNVNRQMYWTEPFGSNKIVRANYDGSNRQDVLTGLTTPGKIALDVGADKMFWLARRQSDAKNTIVQANLDGSNKQDVITVSGASLSDIALDIENRHMYWSEWNLRKIVRANFDGSNRQDVLTGSGVIDSIALDVQSRQIYWAERRSGGSAIVRGDYDGSTFQDVITGLDDVWSIALDVQSRQIYWTERIQGQDDSGKIRRANLDGTQIQDVVAGLYIPTSITLMPPSTVNIPDANLRAKIEQALGKASGDTITTADMARLTRLGSGGTSIGSNISDLTGLEHATNLTSLGLRGGSRISDLSPLSRLTNLTNIDLAGNNISDLSPLSGLTNLTSLTLGGNRISDLSPLSGLTQLTSLLLDGNTISNLSPLSRLTQLRSLALGRNRIVNLSPLSGLTQLGGLGLENNSISDITPLSGLTQLNWVELDNNTVSDIASLSGLTNLFQLFLTTNTISDITPLSGLTNLRELTLKDNTIVNLSPLVSNTGLGRGDTVDVRGNPLSAVSINTHIPTLQGRGVDVEFDAPAPAQTVNIPDANLRTAIESALDKASGATITTADMARLIRLDASNSNISDLTGLENATNLTELHLWDNNITDLSALTGLTNLTQLRLDHNTISDISALSGLTNLEGLELQENSISDLSPLVSNAGLGAGDEVDLRGNPLNAASINTHIPALQRRGVEVEFNLNSNATVSVFPSSVHSPAVGDQFTLSLTTADGTKVTGYQATVVFNASALRYVGSANGDYLPAGAFFVPPIADGNSVTLAGTSLSGESARNTGTLATITFSVVAVKASTVHLWDVLLTDSLGGSSIPQIQAAEITESPQLPEDVNQDGTVNILDLTLVASNFGETGQNDADVNGDGVVNIVDLTLVAAAFGQTAAAPGVWSRHPEVVPTREQVQQWLYEARQMNLADSAFQRGILMLEQLLVALTPKETALLSNYPNPFNPETWIPYQLAKPAEVTLRIYAANGQTVRTLAFGHQAAGFYEDRHRAAYWDGRNGMGEPVGSGVYFYTLTAGDFTTTRKMLILK